MLKILYKWCLRFYDAIVSQVGEDKTRLLLHYFILVRSKMDSSGEHCLRMVYCRSHSKYAVITKRPEFVLRPHGRHRRITSRWGLSGCISVAFVMEIDAGVDEHKQGGGDKVKWEGRHYAAQMSCNCISASFKSQFGAFSSKQEVLVFSVYFHSAQQFNGGLNLRALVFRCPSILRYTLLSPSSQTGKNSSSASGRIHTRAFVCSSWDVFPHSFVSPSLSLSPVSHC